MYGITIHELTHAAHQEHIPNNYGDIVWKAYIDPAAWNVKHIDGYYTQKQIHARRLMESWAVAVEIYLTNLRYQRLGEKRLGEDADRFYKNQTWGKPNFQNVAYNATDDVNMFYTPLFYDLIDTFNQRSDFGSIDNNLSIDRVSGFTIKKIQDIILDCTSWGGVQDKLRPYSAPIQDINGNTIIPTDELLNNWQ